MNIDTTQGDSTPTSRMLERVTELLKEITAERDELRKRAEIAELALSLMR